MPPQSAQNASVMPAYGSNEYFGLPASDSTSVIPILNIQNPDQTQTPGFIQGLEAFASGAVSSVETGAKDLFAGAQNASAAAVTQIQSAVETGYSAVKTVGNDLSSGAKGIVGFGVNQVVILVVVLGVALYFVGKTGAFKVSV